MGLVMGLFFILVDTLLSPLRRIGPLPHPPFPTSVVASIAAGIGEELLFRLFFISFWVWFNVSFVQPGAKSRKIAKNK
jgi:membrane protease YdiL (CAAX protease family)